MDDKHLNVNSSDDDDVDDDDNHHCSNDRIRITATMKS
jgi:hypothetical protein